MLLKTILFFLAVVLFAMLEDIAFRKIYGEWPKKNPLAFWSFAEYITSVLLVFAFVYFWDIPAAPVLHDGTPMDQLTYMTSLLGQVVLVGWAVKGMLIFRREHRRKIETQSSHTPVQAAQSTVNGEQKDSDLDV